MDSRVSLKESLGCGERRLRFVVASDSIVSSSSPPSSMEVSIERHRGVEVPTFADLSLGLLRNR